MSAAAIMPTSRAVEALDLDVARTFLDALGGGQFGFATFDDTNAKDQSLARRMFGDLDSVAENLAELNAQGAGVFVTVNKLDAAGFKKANVTGVRAVFVDLDLPPGESLRQMQKARDSCPPSIIVQTSLGRFHLYWVLSGALPLDEFSTVQKALAAHFNGDPAVCDLPRVMRLPGFFHRKREPFRARIVSLGETWTYDPAARGGFTVDCIMPHYSADELRRAFPTRGRKPGPVAARAERFDVERVRSALAAIPADDYPTWCLVLAALKLGATEAGASEDEALGLAIDWSATSEKFEDPAQVRDKWASFERAGPDAARLGTIFALAKKHGWEPPSAVLADGEPTYVARRFAEICNIRHWRGDFFEWRDDQWRGVTDDDLRARLYLWLENARVKKGEQTVRFRPDRASVTNVLDALAGVRHLNDGQDAPLWMDTRAGDPDPRRLLPFQNGVLDLETLELLPPDPRFFALHACPCAYDPRAEAPTWTRFLDEIFSGDPDSVACVNEILGYCLAADTSMQKAFVFQGARRSGKGTIARILRHLVGASRYAGPTVSAFASNFGLQNLIGANVAVIADARGSNRHDPHAIVERILTITGEDAITIDRKYKTPWDGRLPTRLIYVSNVPPRFRDPSGVIVSRFIAINFQRSFEGQEDPDLERKLVAELPGIVNHALAGLRRLRERGRFLQPKTGETLLQAMDRQTGPVRAFVQEECVTGHDEKIEAASLYQSFCDWCIEHGHQKMASSTFGADLYALNLGIEKRRDKDRGADGQTLRVYRYHGIDLDPDGAM